MTTPWRKAPACFQERKRVAFLPQKSICGKPFHLAVGHCEFDQQRVSLRQYEICHRCENSAASLERVARASLRLSRSFKLKKRIAASAARGKYAVRRSRPEIRRRESNFRAYAWRYSWPSAAYEPLLRLFKCLWIVAAASSPLSKAMSMPLPVNGSMKAAASPIVNSPGLRTKVCLPKPSTATLSHSPWTSAPASAYAARGFFVTIRSTTVAGSELQRRTSLAAAIKHRLLRPLSILLSPPYPPR